MTVYRNGGKEVEQLFRHVWSVQTGIWSGRLGVCIVSKKINKCISKCVDNVAIYEDMKSVIREQKTI